MSLPGPAGDLNKLLDLKTFFFFFTFNMFLGTRMLCLLEEKKDADKVLFRL